MEAFLEIGRWLHLADNSRDDESDKFFNIRNMSKTLNRTSAQNRAQLRRWAQVVRTYE